MGYISVNVIHLNFVYNGVSTGTRPLWEGFHDGNGHKSHCGITVANQTSSGCYTLSLQTSEISYSELILPRKKRPTQNQSVKS